jgi:hypothetical protein
MSDRLDGGQSDDSIGPLFNRSECVGICWPIPARLHEFPTAVCELRFGVLGA